MNKEIIIELFSTDSIQIKNIDLLSDRYLIKLKLFINQIAESEVAIGEKEIIIYCADKFIIGETTEKLISFFNSININYAINEELNKIVQKNIDNKNKAIANKALLKKIKDNTLINDLEFNNYKKDIDNLLVIKLKDYQYKSSYLLSTAKSGFDFSVPGSGKTIITYATYAYLKSKEEISKILIIGPKNAYNAWYEEYITCFGKNPEFKNLSEANISDAQNYLGSSLNNHKEVTFINIDKIRNLKPELIKYISSENIMLVIDEGHKVKNPNASSTKVAMSLAKYSNHKIILTGTPMPNGYEDLYSLTNIINPYSPIIPYNYRQLRTFTVRGIKEDDEKKIMDSLYPFYSRVSKKYLINRGELLPPNYTICYSEMDEDQRYVYDFIDSLIANYTNRWELEFERILMKAILIRKMQVSSNPKLLRKSIITSFEELRGDLVFCEDSDEITNEKIEEFKEKLAIADKIINNDINKSNVGNIIKQYINNEKMVNKNILAVNLVNQLLSEGKKVILWDTFVENMETLKEMLLTTHNIEAGIINGTVTGEERQNVIDRFRYDDLKVLIASPATLAESISLHRCCQNAIYVNRNFNAAQFIQSKDRIHRINMPEGLTANYYFLMNRESVDEGISERLELKETRMLRILDADYIQIGELESQDNSIMSDEDVLSTYQL